jgi:hypothetical protein
LSRSHILLAGCLLVGALLLRLPGITEPSIEQRETQSALLARQWYLDDRSELPVWKQRVLRALPSAVKPIEPPILDFLAASEFRLTGENFWFPRLVSSLMWIVGGVFMYLIATRLTTRDGALIALALYLTWPFATWLSRHFMPDATMVALLLAAALTVIRYWERPSLERLILAGAVSSFATVVKPGVASFYLIGLFVALAVSQRKVRATLVGGQLPLFVALTVMAAGIYYLWGAYLSDFIWSEAGTGRLTLDFVSTERFWTGWWDAVSYLVRYPQQQSFLALLPLAAAAAGFLLAPRGVPRAILAGLSLGYLAFALTFATYVSSNPYYSLPLVPILALSIGVLAGRILETRRGAFAPIARAGVFAVVAVVIGVAAFKSHSVLTVAIPRERIADYRRIGEITNHTTRAMVVDNELSTPSMYWGWIVGRSWELGYPSPPPWIRPEEADFLVVVGVEQFDASEGLRDFVRALPIVARTSRYAIFDLRGAPATPS